MSAAEVLKKISDEDIAYVDLRFCDTRGKEQHVTMPAAAVDEDFFEDGKMFDGSSIAGWKGINESDMVLLPDADTDSIVSAPSQTSPTSASMETIVNVTLPIFTIMGLGYACGYWKVLDAAAADGLNKFVYLIALPAAMFTFSARAPTSR